MSYPWWLDVDHFFVNLGLNSQLIQKTNKGPHVRWCKHYNTYPTLHSVGVLKQMVKFSACVFMMNTLSWVDKKWQWQNLMAVTTGEKKHLDRLMQCLCAQGKALPTPLIIYFYFKVYFDFLKIPATFTYAGKTLYYKSNFTCPVINVYKIKAIWLPLILKLYQSWMLSALRAIFSYVTLNLVRKVPCFYEQSGTECPTVPKQIPKLTWFIFKMVQRLRLADAPRHPHLTRHHPAAKHTTTPSSLWQTRRRNPVICLGVLRKWHSPWGTISKTCI